jgi:hypothetical protein
MAKQIKKIPNKSILVTCLWNNITVPDTIKNPPKEAISGQGLSFNKRIGVILK